MHFDDKDDDGASGSDEVGYEYEDTRTAQHQSLTHKTETADRHHDETW